MCAVYYKQLSQKYTIDGFIHKASHYFKNEEYLQAIKYYRKIISIGEVTDEKIYINAAIALIRTGYYEQAINLLHKMEKELPPSYEMYYLLAYSYYLQINNVEKTNNFKIPIKYLRKSLEFDSRNKDAYKLLGTIYEKTNNFNVARQWYKKASLEDIDNSSEFYGFIANTFFKEKKYDQAIKYYEKAIEGNKNYISAYYNIAEIYKEQQDFDKAEQYYQKTIQMSPDYIYPYYQIGNLYFNKQDYATAIEWYQKALNIEPNEETVNFYIGIAYKKINEMEKAVEHLQKSAYCGNDDALRELKGIS